MRAPKLSAKDLKRLQDLWARIIDPASASEETSTARTKLNELLNKNGLTRHDLPKIMAKIEMQRMAAEEAAAAATRAAGWKKGPNDDDLGIPGNNLLGLMLTLIEEYIGSQQRNVWQSRFGFCTHTPSADSVTRRDF